MSVRRVTSADAALSPQWGTCETSLGATWGILSCPFTCVSLCPSSCLRFIWHRPSSLFLVWKV